MITPQRLFSSPPAAATAGPLMGGLLASRPASQQVAMRASAVGSSSSYQLPRRSSSTNRERPGSMSQQQQQSVGVLPNSGAASLRATLHTDTIGAAGRTKAQPVVVISQSSDFAGSGWRTPLTPGVAASSSRPSSTIARVLAPNGQPRKLPAAALAAALAPPAAAATGSTMVKGAGLGPATPQQQANSGRLSAYYSS
ncbi:hypothetical protein COO60DRAFT_1293132 [Scenedesmus sp. NREL 46B-D3]|nr:hypothetical protein COO60DRAFT_1293132 [Scenedesmus sp. NREL 46B-D3]